jgi:HK97 gp10 family phage protein
MARAEVHMTADFEGAVTDGIGEFLDRVGDAWVDGAKRAVPVRTGQLRSSIRFERHDTHLTLIAGDSRAPYAAYVELGTSRAPAQPFMRPALQALKGLMR